MIILRTFSETEKSSNTDASKLLAAGGVIGFKKRSFKKRIGRAFGNRYGRSRISSKEEKVLRKKLLKDARESGAEVKEWRLPSSGYNSRKDRITLGQNADAATVAHEMGHREHLRPGGSGSIIGKAAHKVGGLSKVTLHPKHPLGKTIRGGIFINGVHSGYKKEKNKKEGKKTGIVTKTKSVALPAALMSPLLIAEASASRKGYKMLKKSGASKEFLKAARKRYRNAYGTYVASSTSPVLAGVSGELVGRGLGKLDNSNKKDK